MSAQTGTTLTAQHPAPCPGRRDTGHRLPVFVARGKSPDQALYAARVMGHTERQTFPDPSHR